jgi:hypothetical protein
MFSHGKRSERDYRGRGRVPVAVELEEDLERLEAELRQLKIEYDMFFAGAMPKPPIEHRAAIERMIKQYSQSPFRKYAARFHFNSIVSKFNSFSELWAKTLRTVEEGDRPAPAVADRAGAGARVLATCRVKDPSKEHESLRQLHARFLELRKKLGTAEGKLSFESFVSGVASQAKKLREKAGCHEVELRLVVEDRKVQLKARPGR